MQLVFSEHRRFERRLLRLPLGLSRVHSTWKVYLPLMCTMRRNLLPPPLFMAHVTEIIGKGQRDFCQVRSKHCSEDAGVLAGRTQLGNGLSGVPIEDSSSLGGVSLSQKPCRLRE
jgi:hypothetical protein